MAPLIYLNRAEKFIIAISSIIALAIFLFTDPVFFNPDSIEYLKYAHAISRFTVSSVAYSRTAGYPLLLVATLYPWTFSVIPILAVQACCMALIPLIIYKTLRFISPRTAFYGAGFIIATLIPYTFQTYLFPDPMQVFFSIVFCYVVVRYIFERTTKIMVRMFLFYLAISFFRPPFLLYYFIIAAVVAMAVWQDRKHLAFYLKPFITLTLLISSIHIFASTLDTYLYMRKGVERKSLVGKMVFLNAFTRSTSVKGAFTDGKHTAIMHAKLVSFFKDAPLELRSPKTLFAGYSPAIAKYFDAYKSDPEQMTNALLNMRSNYIWNILRNISDNWLDSNRDINRLFGQVALEQYRLHPKIFLNVVTTGFSYYLGIRACKPPSIHSSAEEYACQFWPPYYTAVYEDPRNGPIRGMRPYIFKQVSPVILKKIIALFTTFGNETWPSLYRVILPTSSFLTFLALCYVCYCFLRAGIKNIRKDVIVLFTVLSVFLFYSIPMFILTDPQFRYVSAGSLFLVMSGIISLRMIVTALFSIQDNKLNS